MSTQLGKFFVHISFVCLSSSLSSGWIESCCILYKKTM